MLDDNIKWYKSLKYIENKYRVDKSLILAFIKQESSFNANARPPKNYFLGFIPTGRSSSSYGYAQAKDETWDWYQQKTGNDDHRRSNFHHAIEFIAWYVNQTNKLNNVARTDVYNQYLAYHEGHSGFKNKNYKTKDWLIKVSKKVAATARSYKSRLKTCSKQLNNTFPWSYF